MSKDALAFYERLKAYERGLLAELQANLQDGGE